MPKPSIDYKNPEDKMFHSTREITSIGQESRPMVPLSIIEKRRKNSEKFQLPTFFVVADMILCLVEGILVQLFYQKLQLHIIAMPMHGIFQKVAIMFG